MRVDREDISFPVCTSYLISPVVIVIDERCGKVWMRPEYNQLRSD